MWEMNVDTGAVIDRIEVGSPSYACIYAADGRRVATAIGGQQINVYARNFHDILGSIRGFKFQLKQLPDPRRATPKFS